MEKHPVKINILTFAASFPETVEVMSRGVLTRDKGQFLIEYEDHSYLGGSLTHFITVSDNLVTINRTGALNSTMVFERGKSYNGSIVTPAGEMPLRLFSHVVDSSFDDDSLCVNLKYTIDVGGSETLNDLRLRATVTH